jgi:hypothetical protein
MPSPRQSLLADAIAASPALLARYLVGFDDSNHTRQAPGLPNHVAWCLGHLALTMHRPAVRLSDPAATPQTSPLPESDFIPGASAGDARRFGTETVAFGSRPVADPALYPPFTRCVEIFNSACATLAAAVREAPDAALDKPTKWGAGEIPVSGLVARMVFHNGTHTGQIADLRRALGFKSIYS